MDAQEIRNLQEAYMEVVENQQIDEISTELAKRAGEKRMNRTFDIMQKDWEEGRKKPSPEYQKSYKKFQDDERRYKRKLNKEQVDIYDIILSHLLDEGYAETLESAEVIMANMSEEWVETIIEAKMPYPEEKVARKRERVKRAEDVAIAQRKYGEADKLYKRGVALATKTKMGNIGMR